MLFKRNILKLNNLIMKYHFYIPANIQYIYMMKMNFMILDSISKNIIMKYYLIMDKQIIMQY